MRGEAHYRSLLTTEQVVAIFLSLDKCIALSIEYGVSLATIYNIKNRRAWAHITKHLSEPPNWRRRQLTEKEKNHG